MEQQTTRESTPRGHFDSFASFLESKKAIPLRIVILLLWLAAFAFGVWLKARSPAWQNLIRLSSCPRQPNLRWLVKSS